MDKKVVSYIIGVGYDFQPIYVNHLIESDTDDADGVKEDDQ